MKHRFSKSDVLLALITLIGLAGVVGLSRLIDARQPATLASATDDQLYLSGSTVKRVSIGFNGLAADCTGCGRCNMWDGRS